MKKFLVLTWVFYGSVWAGPLENLCRTLAMKRAQEVAGASSAVELELGIIPQVWRLMDSTDGTVRAIFTGIPADRLEIPAGLQSKYPNLEALLASPFRQLSQSDAISLINEASRLRGQDFWQDRAIPGLKIIDSIEVNLKSPLNIGGRTYEAGRQTIPLRDFFTGRVEYLSTEDMSRLQDVEIHIREKRLAGEASIDAVRLLKALEIPIEHQHVHMVADIKLDLLSSKSDLAITGYSLLHRNANLTLEMIDLVEMGANIKPNIINGVVWFDSLSSNTLQQVAQYFQSVARGNSPILGSMLKMGWVGFRGMDFYDAHGLMGLEWRSVNPNYLRSTTYQQVLNRAHQTMLNGEFSISTQQIQNWLSTRNPSSDLPTDIAGTWYNQPTERLVAALPQHLRPVHAARPELMRDLDQRADTNGREVKMLFFDWSRDPMVASDPKLLAKINAAQKLVLERVSADELINAVPDFLQYSGLYSHYLKAWGFNIKPLTKSDPFWQSIIAMP